MDMLWRDQIQEQHIPAVSQESACCKSEQDFETMLEKAEENTRSLLFVS